MAPTTTQTGRGTLEDPEVLQHVPGHVIPILEREFEDFSTEAGRFIADEIAEDEFIKFRLRQGVYGQRQPDVQMIRVKLPFGGVTPEQLDAFASVAERYAPLRRAHITTRQCIQMHHIPLPDVEPLMREIAQAGLSSREGCGNTVRNVTADPWAGVAVDELFDITPYAAAYARYFVRHPTTQAMPRKVKTAFDGGPQDRAISTIHDIAFRARVRELPGGETVRAVQVLVGGGTSIMPRTAKVLWEFAELENGEYLKLAEAVFRIFERQDWLRVNRARARLKVFVDKYGIDELRSQVEDELAGDWVAERDFSLDPLLFVDDEQAAAPSPRPAPEMPNGDLREFERFAAGNVRPQRQDGFVTVEVRVTRGDLEPDQLRGLADVMREYSGGYARTTIGQNLLLRWVREETAYEVFKALGALGLDSPGAREITDVVSCPGTDSCKLGITSSMGLNRAVQERLESLQIGDPLVRQMQVRMSGCPNGCSQHHIADIGFYGASIKVGEHTIPAYVPHVGGIALGGEVRFATRLKLRLPAKRVPEVIERWVRLYEAERDDGEPWKTFIERAGTGRLEASVSDLSLPVDFGLETVDTFIDWNRQVPFKVERGEGECAV